ncbi:MAG TPA: hypothetical protein VMF58_05080 [Rhizomicrobium sp.]|nr:hypothetical protein [Rhizomicrobium sp.]
MRWVIVLLLFSSASAVAAPTITKDDARHAPPEWVIGRVLRQAADLIPKLSEKDRARALGDLADVVESNPDAVDRPPPASDTQGIRRTLDAVQKLVTIWPDPFNSPRPRHPLREIELQTRPHAGRVPGLCFYDVVVMGFTPVEADIGPATRVQASEIHVQRWYHVLSPPAAPQVPFSSSEQRARDDASCKPLDEEKDHFFGAPDEQQAIRGAWIANTVNAGLHESPMPFTFECRGYGSGDAGCLKWLKPGFLQPQDVGACGTEICSVQIEGFDFEITTDAQVKIRKATASATVVIADAMED